MTVAPSPPAFLPLVLQIVAILAVIDGSSRRGAGWLAAAARRAVSHRSSGTRVDELVERLVVTALLAVAFVVGLTQVLGFSGALRPLPVALVTAAYWVGCRIVSARAAPAAPAPRLAGIQISLGSRVVAGVAVVAGLSISLRALLLSPTEWDGLTYHLLYPAHYLQSARISPVEFGSPHDRSALFPGNGEIVHAFLMLFVRTDLLVALGMVACWLFGAAALYSLGRRSGLSEPTAAGVALLGVTLPALASRAASSYVEPLLLFALLSAILFTLQALSESDRVFVNASFAGIAGGLAIGTKYVALPVVAVAFIALAVRAGLGSQRRRAALAILLFASGVLLWGGSWYLRNAGLTGNPIFPAPFLGLPHLEQPGFEWVGWNLATRWRSLAAMGFLGDALFGLPPSRFTHVSLGLTTLLALPLVPLSFLQQARDALRSGFRRASANGAAAETLISRIFLPVTWIVMVGTYLYLPYWGKVGWFWSGVRFAVPAAALAILFAFSALERLGVPTMALALVGAGCGLAQSASAGLLSPVRGMGQPVLLVAGALGLAIACTRVASRYDAPILRAAMRAAAFVIGIVTLHLAWVEREIARDQRWTAPKFFAAEFALAAQAVERVAPGPVKVAWAASSESEFLYMFLGRRLERRLVVLPLHEGPRSAWAYADGDARRGADRSFWLRALAAERPDILVVSRWKANRELWPVEDDWAVEEQFERVVDQERFRAYRLPENLRGASGENQRRLGG